MLYVTSDDGVRLWIDGKLVIDNWTNHAPSDNSCVVRMNAGQLYAVRLEYFENGGGAVARLSWSTPTYARHYIEPTQLYPAQLSAGADERVDAPASGGSARCGLGGGIGLIAALGLLMRAGRGGRARADRA